MAEHLQHGAKELSVSSLDLLLTEKASGCRRCSSESASSQATSHSAISLGSQLVSNLSQSALKIQPLPVLCM